MSDPIERLNAALSGRYTLERELGAGGMATVYLAEDLKHDRKVALKVLKPELAAVVGAERFLAEIRTTANLQHPHILPLFDSGEADGFLYYVMPYIEGETLRDRLDRERQLPVEEALRIATAVANALEAAHEQGVVHRDIKPANILLSRGEPLVADFGIALAVSAGGGGRLTETGLSLGTPYYMSPEQATGDQTVGPASDVFALGCVLYEMLIGEPPYPGSTAQAVLGKIIQGVPVSAKAQRTSVPAHVDAAIRKALEKLPADRFTRAHDFSAALADRSFRHGIEAGAGISTASAGPWNRLSAGLAALLAVVSVLALWGGLAGSPPLATAEPAVHLAFDLGEYTPTRWKDQVIVSPDGSQFAVATDLGGAPGPRVLLYRSADDLTFRPIPGTEGVVPGGYAFSPDGAWITYVADGVIMKVSPRGGPPTTVVSIDERVVDGIDWGAEGWIVFTQFAAAPRTVELFRVPDRGGVAERLVGSPWTPSRPRLLPDGSGVLFKDFQSDRLALYDFDADSVKTLPLSGSAPMYAASGHLVYIDDAGGLWAAPFDLAAKSVTGEARLLLEGVSTNGGDARYHVSRSGTLVYERGASSAELLRQLRLVVMDLEGGEEILPLEPRPLGGARWAPDGRRILFRSPGLGASQGSPWHVYVYDAVVRAAPRQLTFVGSVPPGAAWSPDGRHIAFSSLRDGTDGLDLFVQAVDGDEPARRIVSLPGSQRAHEWTSQGLLFVQDQSSDLWVVDPLADDPVPRPYLESEFTLRLPRVSPDGSHVAYISRESGSAQAYVRTFPDPGPPLLVSDGESPVTDVGWSPDGRTVYYWLAAPVGERLLAAARLGAGSLPTVASRDTLRTLPSDLGSWDMHPDGDRFITQRPVATSRQTIVVMNWFEELLRRMGEGG